MKPLTSSLAGLAVGVLATSMWFIARPTRVPAPTPTARETGAPAPAESLPAPKPGPARPSRPDAGSARRQAEEAIEKLKGLRVSSGMKRHAVQRQAIHQLETLVDLGAPALPVIREFLGRFEDLEYPTDRDEAAEDPSERRERWLPGRMPGVTPTALRPPTLDFASPPSLRLGLIDALQGIGGPEAEQILAEVLTATGRAVEVACAARALQEIAPDRYREAAVGVARELLTSPQKTDRTNRLDENSQAYLYHVLAQYGDVSFASTVRSLLVTAEGQIDRMALNYLTSIMKADAVPALYQAYRDPQLTNMTDRVNLASHILTHAGADARANDIFRDLVRDAQTPAWVRTMTIQSLAGGRGPMSVPAPTEAAQIQARIDLLNGLQDLSDERMSRVRDETVKRLTVRLEAATASPADGGGVPGDGSPKP